MYTRYRVQRNGMTYAKQYQEQTTRIHLPSEMLLYPRQGANAGPPPEENAPHRLLGAMT